MIRFLFSAISTKSYCLIFLTNSNSSSICFYFFSLLIVTFLNSSASLSYSSWSFSQIMHYSPNSYLTIFSVSFLSGLIVLSGWESKTIALYLNFGPRSASASDTVYLIVDTWPSYIDSINIIASSLSFSLQFSRNFRSIVSLIYWFVNNSLVSFWPGTSNTLSSTSPYSGTLITSVYLVMETVVD